MLFDIRVVDLEVLVHSLQLPTLFEDPLLASGHRPEAIAYLLNYHLRGLDLLMIDLAHLDPGVDIEAHALELLMILVNEVTLIDLNIQDLYDWGSLHLYNYLCIGLK